MALPPPPPYANRSLVSSRGPCDLSSSPQSWQDVEGPNLLLITTAAEFMNANVTLSRRWLCATFRPIFQPLPSFCLSFHSVFLNLGGGGDGDISGWVTVTHSTVSHLFSELWLVMSIGLSTVKLGFSDCDWEQHTNRHNKYLESNSGAQDLSVARQQ